MLDDIESNHCGKLVRITSLRIYYGRKPKCCSQIYREVDFKPLRKELLHDPVIPVLAIYPKKLRSGSQRSMHPMFIVTLFTITKI